MRNILIIAFLSATLVGCSSIFGVSDKNMKVGEMNKAEWFACTYTEPLVGAEYDAPQIDMMKTFHDSKQISYEIFAGSWCGDSKEELPIIFSIFDKTGIDTTKYKIYGVDRDKEEPSGIAEQKNIEKVPTLIILSQGREIGRIVEFPNDSWINNMFEILIKN